jgi:hypothetical protein
LSVLSRPEKAEELAASFLIVPEARRTEPLPKLRVTEFEFDAEFVVVRHGRQQHGDPTGEDAKQRQGAGECCRHH